MKTFLKLTLFTGIVILAECVAVERILEIKQGHFSDQRARQISPFYVSSTYTTHGVYLGGIQQGLKIMLRPLIVYGNFPDTDHANYHINHYGFRGRDFEPRKEKKKRVIVVGGSMAFGTGLRSNEETFSSQLEKLLQDVDVINAAVIGHKSKNELAYLVDELVDFQPDLVLTLDGYNDCHFTWDDSTSWNYGVNGFDQLEHLLGETWEFRSNNFFARFFSIPRLLFPKLLYHSRHLIREFRHGASADQKKVLPAEITAIHYAKNLEKMNVVAVAFHAKFLGILQPQKNPNEKLYDEFRTAVEKILEEKKVPFLDLQDRREVFSENMFMDEMHLDGRGHAVMAELIEGKIRELLNG